jgi:serine protease
VGLAEGLPANPHPARVVNLSLAGAGPCSAPLQETIDEARARGVLVVAAAGNQGDDYRGYFPANCREVLAVGAVGPDGRLAPYANRGAPLLAPRGNMILSCLSNHPLEGPARVIVPQSSHHPPKKLVNP